MTGMPADLATPESCADTLALSVIGKIAIAPEVECHRFYLEGLNALAVAIEAESFKERVIGTSDNIRDVQLYGWAPNIASHCDNTGLVYGVCLNAGVTHLYATDQRTPVPGPTLEIVIGAGDVFRLNDRYTHWTLDDGPRIAAFVGPFKVASDDEAMHLLGAAILKLAQGAYAGAPRVSAGFRVIQADECWATRDFENRELMLVSEAKATKAEVIQCSTCGAPATRIDHFWPYESSMNRCTECFTSCSG